MKQKGFTIIELLVVIVVIGILTTISVVAYKGYQKNGQDATVKSDLDSIAGLLENYRTTSTTANPGGFPPDKPGLTTLGIKVTKTAYDTTVATNVVYCVSSDSQSFALVALSKSGNYIMITQDGFQTYSLGAAAFLNTATLCAAIKASLTFVSTGWNSSDMTTGPWRAWAGGN